ncbi:MAG: LuxR C-terminal-related transcriptional regulator [Novosphingobium sp.]
MGRQLNLSPFTVRNHISLLFRVLGAASRADLAELARRQAAD